MSKLPPSPGGGVLWHVPNRKRAVAETTVATSDLIALLVMDGAKNFGDLRKKIRYDSDAIALCDIMEKCKVLDTPLEIISDGHINFVEDE